MNFSLPLLTWVERLTGLNQERVHSAITSLGRLDIKPIERELLSRPSIDTAVALTLLDEALDELQRARVSQNKLVAKLRNDPDVWPTWAELRAATILLRTMPLGTSIRLDPNRIGGKQPDYQFIQPNGKELKVEFKAIGLSDEEAAFCERLSPFLETFLPTFGLLTIHARLNQTGIPFSRKQIADSYRQAENYARSTPDYPNDLSGIAIAGHFGESNYVRRLSLRLEKEIIEQIPPGNSGWAAFYWTNSAPIDLVLSHLRWGEIHDGIEGIIFVGDAVAFPHANIHSYSLISPNGAEPEGESIVRSTASDTRAMAVLERFERSTGVRATLLSARTERGQIELLRRDGTRRILPFNLLLDEDPKDVMKKRGGH
jgi:hypothetical protein